MFKVLSAALLGGLVAVGGSMAFGAINVTGGTVPACVQNNQGDVRIPPDDGACKSNETRLPLVSSVRDVPIIWATEMSSGGGQTNVSRGRYANGGELATRVPTPGIVCLWTTGWRPISITATLALNTEDPLPTTDATVLTGIGPGAYTEICGRSELPPNGVIRIVRPDGGPVAAPLHIQIIGSTN